MNNILVTGGAGFIGSHLVERLAASYPDAAITILDKMTYAADIENLDKVLKRYQRRLVVGDVCDFDLCAKLTKNIDCVIHTAAESHVDNAFGNSLQFTKSNTLGTHTLLEASRLNSVPLFLHLSTDEVYGEIDEGSFHEDSILNPSNPYSGSKASAEMIVNSYRHSFKMPIVTVRANNIFGKRQYPEKIIPKFTLQFLTGNKMTIHGNGKNTRRYLAVEDLAEAIVMLLEKGVRGETYNIGSEEEYSNIKITTMICNILGADFDQVVRFVDDRPFNDSRYSIDCKKIHSLGWQPTRQLKSTLREIVSWYVDNKERYKNIFDDNTT